MRLIWLNSILPVKRLILVHAVVGLAHHFHQMAALLSGCQADRQFEQFLRVFFQFGPQPVDHFFCRIFIRLRQ